jgi:NDP-sugar pyrophosphorylase family protein
MMTEQGSFSIIDSYLRVAEAGETISGFRADEYYWRDLGKAEHIAKAAEDILNRRIVLSP